MTDAGFPRVGPTLDPTAQEFIPTYPYPYPYATTTAVAIPFFTNQVYYTFPSPPPPVTLPPPSPVPTRALLLSSVPTHVSETTVRRELEVFGDVRAVQMDRLLDGIVTVHFYDIRQATAALKKIQDQHMQQQHRLLRVHFDGLAIFYRVNPLSLPPPARGLVSGRAIWAQFTFPVDTGVPDGYNQGTVSVFNLDSSVSTRFLKGIFEAYGCVKEIRDTPLKKSQKFVEFYDTRDARKAVAGLNNQEINGKTVLAEFCPPVGHKFKYKQNKFIPISSFSRSSPPPLCRKDRAVDFGGDYGCEPEVISYVNPPRKGGLKKNVKHFYQHQQASEQQVRWLNGDGRRNKPLKGPNRCHNREKSDPRFFIIDGVISSFEDSRTTVMIKNIPNKYSQKLLLNVLDRHCIQCNEDAEGGGGDDRQRSSYDFVYLPIDFVNKCNVGYGFVNMTSPEATRRLYKSFHNKNWEDFNSKKICEVSYARLQGLEALKDHFKNSNFPQVVEEYMPVSFSPPRDGRALTEPTPIVGRSLSSSTGTTTTMSSASFFIDI